MNLNYEKIKTRIENGGHAWTSYSDLFLVLSVIFLLLYVVSSLRGNAASMVNAQNYRKVAAENESLRKQISAYEVLKDDYLSQGASQEQVNAYQQMVGRLDLLSEETRADRQQLEEKTRSLNEKEQALNQYQLMIKSVINANLVAQGRLHQRDLKIEEREKWIHEKDRSISSLNDALQSKQDELAHKEREITENGEQIQKIQEKLERSVQEVRFAYRSKKKSQEAMLKEVARLRADGDSRIGELRAKSAADAKQLKATQEILESKSRELEGAIGALRDRERQFHEIMDKANAEHRDKEALIERQKAEFQSKLAATRGSADEKLRRQKDYLAQVENEKAANDRRLRKARADLEDTRKNLLEMEASYQSSLGSLANSNATLKKELKETITRANERRALSARIAVSLAKAGITAQVDRESGEVAVQFMEEYFEYGKAELKPKMKAQLEKFFPAYASALFAEKNSARHIANVDIVGFASPTFRGRYVDPASLGPGEREAVNFNMDLSYRRAKAIFGYVFDTTKMKYERQQELLPLVRVSGRSYLTEKKPSSARTPASMSPDGDYCQNYDCQKSQRVILKFNLKEE